VRGSGIRMTYRFAFARVTGSVRFEVGHVSTLQAGYALGDRVIRPAKVSIRPSADQGGDEFPPEK